MDERAAQGEILAQASCLVSHDFIVSACFTCSGKKQGPNFQVSCAIEEEATHLLRKNKKQRNFGYLSQTARRGKNVTIPFPTSSKRN